MARNDGIDRTVARNQDLETPADVAKVQEHNERCLLYTSHQIIDTDFMVIQLINIFSEKTLVQP